MMIKWCIHFPNISNNVIVLPASIAKSGIVFNVSVCLCVCVDKPASSSEDTLM